MKILAEIVATSALASLFGCGRVDPGPSPTPPGQIGPGEPDESGIPRPPRTGPPAKGGG